MSELKEYTYDDNGQETTVLLNDEDAKARGLDGGKDRDVKFEVPEKNRDVTEQTTESSAGVQPGVGVLSTKAKGADNK